MRGQWAVEFFDGGFRETFSTLGIYDDTDAEVDAIVALLDLPRGARILDIPCGFGRHAGPLGRRGYQVVGVDNSPSQLDDARRGYPDCTFVLADMRTPPAGPYDAVLNLWTSFGLLDTRDDDRAALAAWADVLAPGGRLVMDIDVLESFEHRVRSGGEPISHQLIRRHDLLGRARFDWAEQELALHWARPGWSRRCRLRMYSRRQLETALREVGFLDITFAGDLYGGPVDPDRRTVIVATK
ncbi:class I SAM-dependent methyltransferase [Nocardia cyriacigeorgica]|uniref:class I SAM-dependent methyltransferase n=1 Tax=Nocardia cyriacigeorgica TaxID=135487 RepID=UPI0018955668|nr:class I SAM-dependent methyltransferase [Nocardia cyriacigeorgica]MBF6435321.1 methyltransferase domain-containing protein [Nocardia cyriacigeorgica]